MWHWPAEIYLTAANSAGNSPYLIAAPRRDDLVLTATADNRHSEAVEPPREINGTGHSHNPPGRRNGAGAAISLWKTHS